MIRRTRPLPDRFWSKVDRRADNECWPWRGSFFGNGYGQFSVARENDAGIVLTNLRGGGTLRYTMTTAHRVAYQLLIGPVPDGLQLDHLCRNRWCVNPHHLEAVTIGENYRRGEGPTGTNYRKTHCIHGHLFDEENTAYQKDGSRRCRECARFRQTGFAQRQRRYGPNKKPES